jgi:hypothetical protein
MSLLISFLLNISGMNYLSKILFVSDLLGSHGMDFHESLYSGRLLYRYILPGRRKVSDKSCRGNQNTQFMANNFFPESHAL